jgi:hypothetical protein
VVLLGAVLTGVGLSLLCVPVCYIAKAEGNGSTGNEECEHNNAEERRWHPQLVEVVRFFSSNSDRGEN